MKRWLASLLLLLCSVLILVPVFVGFSATGACWSLAFAERFLPVEARGVRGSIISGLLLDRFTYGDEGLAIQARGVELAVDWRCALRSEICLERLHAASLQVEQEEAGTDGNREPLDIEALFSLLPKTRVRDFYLGEFHWRRGTQAQVLRELELRGVLNPDELNAEHLAVCHAYGCGKAVMVLMATGNWRLEAEFQRNPEHLTDLPGELPTSLALEATGDLVSLEARLSAPVEPDLGVSVSLDRGDGDGALLVRGEVRGLLRLLPQYAGQPWLQPSGPLRIEGSLLDASATLEIAQSLEGYGAQPADLVLALASPDLMSLTGSLRLVDGDRSLFRAQADLGEIGAWKPALRVDFEDFMLPPGVSDWSPILSGTLHLSLDGAAPMTTWGLHIPQLTIAEGEQRLALTGDLRASETPLLPWGHIDGQLQDPLLVGNTAVLSYFREATEGAPALVDMPDGVELVGFALDTLQMTVQPGLRTGLALRTRGALDSDLELTLRPTDAGVAIHLAPFELAYADQRAISTQSIEAQWMAANEAFEVGPFCLGWRDNEACSSGATLGASGALALQVKLDENYSGAVGDKPFAVTARGSGSLALRWKDLLLEATEFALSMEELTVDPYAEAGTAGPVHWSFARAEGRIDDEARSLALDLRSPQLGVLVMSAQKRDDTLEGRLRASNLALSSLVDLVPEWSLDAGKIDADLTLGGVVEEPEIHGELQLRDGALRLNELDTQLDAINLRVDLQGQSASLNGTAQLGEGALVMDGQCCEEGAFLATVDGQRNRLQLPQGLDAVFSPQLTMRLDTEQLNVTGSLKVHEGVYTHSQPAEGGVALSNDVRRIDVAEEAPRRFLLNLDLQTLIEPGFTLRSREIESTLAGDLRLLLPADAPPSLFGNLRVLGGELRALGQALRLTDGDIGFVGDPQNPDLNISAEREIRAENQRVGFRVRGTLDEPEFTLFSDPPRPDNEALSYLLRGRGPDVGASADGTAMALSVGATALNNSGLLSSLNAIPGLSGVSLGAEGSDDDTAATISAYVGNRLYLSYGVGIYEPVNALTARLYLQSRLWLEVVSRLESSFDLYYRFDRE